MVRREKLRERGVCVCIRKCVGGGVDRVGLGENWGKLRQIV